MLFTYITGFVLLLISSLAVNAQQLTDTIITLEGVVITDKAIQRLQPLSSLEREIIERSAVIDIGEILRSQPNISGIRRGGYAIDPVVRGFRYSQINIFLDEGVHIEGGCPNRMDPVLAHIKSEDIQRLEIAHGPYLFKYGPTLGSSLKVVTRQDNPFGQKKLQATSLSSYDANRNGFRQHLAIKGSQNNMYYRISGGYADYGNYTDGRGNEWKTAFKKYGISADVGFRPSANGQMDISYKGSFARDVMFPALPMDETIDNTNIISAVYTHRNPAHTDDITRISAYYSMVYHEMDNSRRPQYSAVVPPWQGIMQAVAKVDTRSTGTRVIAQCKHDLLMLEGGFDLDHTWKDGSRHMKMIMEMDGQEFINERIVSLWKDARMLNSGLFAGMTAQQGALEFSTTIRTDLNYSTSGDTLFIEKDGRIYYDAKPSTHIFWSLGMNMAYHLSEAWKISLGLGRGVRPPDLSERYIQFLATGFDRYDYLGNPELKPEKNYQADLMFEYSDESFHFFTNIFRAGIHDFIAWQFLPPAVARPQSMGAPGVKQFRNIKRAVFYGFEAGLSSQPARGLNASLSAGYTYAYFPEIEKIILVNAQAIGTETLYNDPVPEIPALESQLAIAYLFFGDKLEPSLELRAVAPQNFISHASYEESTPGYVIAGVAISWKPIKQVHFMAGVNNLFNKAYYEHLNRRIIGEGGNFYEAGRSVFMNLKISFP
jgi:iron complex outermembrane recepter protein